MKRLLVGTVVCATLAGCGGGGNPAPSNPGISSVTKPIGVFERYSTVFGQYSTLCSKQDSVFSKYSTVHTKQSLMITSTEKVKISMNQVTKDVAVGTPMYLNYFTGADSGYVENADSSIAMLCEMQY